MWKNFSRQVLKRKLKALQEKNPSYSLRALARRIDLSPGALSEVLSGRRPITRKNALKLASSTLLTTEEKLRLSKLLALGEKETRRVLGPEMFDLVDDWKYFAILSLTELDHPPQRPEDFAKLLNVGEKEIAKYLERLVDLEMLAQAGNEFFANELPILSSDGLSPETSLQSHMKDLALAKTALHSVPTEVDFSSVTFAASAAQIELARRLIRHFRGRLGEAMGRSEKDQVYRLSVSLYPLTSKA